MSAPLTPQDMVERALQEATAARTDGAIVIVDETSDANLRWANNTLTTNGVTRASRLTVVAAVAGRAGTATGVVSRSVTDTAGISEIVAAAVGAARGGPPADDAQPLVQPAGTPADAWDAPPTETSPTAFHDLVPSLAAALDQARAREQLLFGFAEHSITSTFLGSSTGVRLRYDQPSGRCELNVKSRDFTRSAWGGVGTRDFSDVDASALATGLGDRVALQAKRLDLTPGRYETLLPAGAVADLLIYLYWSAGAHDAHDGQTVFSRAGGGTRVGERLSDLPLTLYSDPREPGLECAPFAIARASSRESSVFDNGLPLARTDWIHDGTLAALLQTRHSAAVSGLPVTPAIDNLMLDGGGTRDIDAMVADTKRGLLLTCLWYIRPVDPQTLLLTGLTRDGVYLVEDGEIVGAVNNFRFNESPVDMLGRVREAGRTQSCLPREWSDYFTRAAMPPLRVDGFNMSTVSQAS